MGQKPDPAQQLDQRASETRSLAEAQALHAQADWIRRARQPHPFTGWALFRN